MIKHLDKVLFALVIAGLVFTYGVAVGVYQWFPYEIARDGGLAARDLIRYWKSYAHIEQIKYLEPDRFPGAGVTTYDPERAQPGLTFMTGLFDGEESLQLVDMQGTLVHRWLPDYDRIWNAVAKEELPAGAEVPFNDWDVLIHGSQPLPDGSVVLNYSDLLLVKIDKCGAPLWTKPYWTHHSVFRSEDGTFWVSRKRYIPTGADAPPRIRPPYYEDMALQVTPSGEILRSIPLDRLLIDSGMDGLLFSTGTAHVKNAETDFVHLNDVEVLQTADADKFPLFEAGDVLISMRNLNLLFVFDPDTMKVKWHQTGPWLRQHDPDFLPDGTISLFNNNRDETSTGTVLGGSNIMVVNPTTGETRVIYRGTADRPFYSNILGKLQHLPNGNFLVTESKGGRAFEFDGRGQIVWEYINRYDEHRVAEVTEATRIMDGFFTVDDWTCQ